MTNFYVFCVIYKRLRGNTMELIKVKRKIISLVLCILFLTSIFAGLTTAKNLGANKSSIKTSFAVVRDDPDLIKIADGDPVCDLGNDFVVYADGSYLYLYNIKTGDTDKVYVGGDVIFPKIFGDRVIYTDFKYMGFKMYNITTKEKTDLVVTNWMGGDADDYQFYGDYIVYENTDSDQYATELFLYNIATHENIQLTDTPGEAFPENPCIYKNIIAWQLTEGPLADIVMYNIDSAEYTRVTNTSQFASETFPSIYENTILYSYFYYDKVNGTVLYGLKMYDITTGDESTIFMGGEPRGGTPEIFGDIIVYSVFEVSLNLLNLGTHEDIPIYEGIKLTRPWNVNEYYVLFTILKDGAYLYRYNTPPEIEITIQGGLGVSATIKNTGASNLTNISWNIALDGKLIFIGKNKPGTIDSLAAGESKTVRDFVLGFGKTVILVTAGSTTRNATGTVFLFFVFGVA